jgi:chemotaxis protein histidine kinase CheA
MHVVYNIVNQRLHGDISCESQLGDGTRFTISIPYTD